MDAGTWGKPRNYFAIGTSSDIILKGESFQVRDHQKGSGLRGNAGMFKQGGKIGALRNLIREKKSLISGHELGKTTG